MRQPPPPRIDASLGPDLSALSAFTVCLCWQVGVRLRAVVRAVGQRVHQRRAAAVLRHVHPLRRGGHLGAGQLPRQVLLPRLHARQRGESQHLHCLPPPPRALKDAAGSARGSPMHSSAPKSLMLLWSFHSALARCCAVTTCGSRTSPCATPRTAPGPTASSATSSTASTASACLLRYGFCTTIMHMQLHARDRRLYKAGIAHRVRESSILL